jgi:membrane-associated protein
VPIVRTLAPFVAGVGRMSYGRFMSYNAVGGVAWVTICLLAGDFFGNLPFVKKNFSVVVLAIIALSLVPAIWEIVRSRRAAATSSKS